MALNQSFCIRYQSITANKAHTSERSTFEKRALVGATSPRIFLKSKTSKRFNLERKTRLQIKFTLSNATLMNADNSYTSASRNWRSFAISRDKFSNRKIPRSLITSHGDVQFSRNVSSDQSIWNCELAFYRGTSFRCVSLIYQRVTVYSLENS